MAMREIKELLSEHPLFKGMTEDELTFLSGCATLTHFEGGSSIFKEGESANDFYVLRRGDVALELRQSERGIIKIQTLHEGDVLGWSWLFPPYKWHFDARAVGMVRAVKFDATCVREKIKEDKALGYDLMEHFASVMLERLQATRLQVLDLYGTSS